MIYFNDHWVSYTSSTWDDFTQLHGDLGLSSLVILQSEFIQDFSCVFGGVLHSIHSCTLFRSNIVKHGVVEHSIDIKFVEELWGVTEIRFLSIMLHNVFETFYELISSHDFSLFENLTDYVFEFVKNKQQSVAILWVF